MIAIRVGVAPGADNRRSIRWMIAMYMLDNQFMKMGEQLASLSMSLSASLQLLASLQVSVNHLHRLLGGSINSLLSSSNKTTMLRVQSKIKITTTLGKIAIDTDPTQHHFYYLFLQGVLGFWGFGVFIGCS